MGRHWSFAHNGSVNRVRVRGLIRPAFLAAYPPNCSYVYDCNDPNSVTDSEYYFIYLLQCIYDNRFNVPAGVAAAMAELRSESGALNFLLSDGMNEWAFRRDDVYGHHTLYWYSRCGDGHASSERPDTTNPYWSFMEDYQLVNLHTGVSIPDVLHLQMLADVAFEDSLDSADLRADTPGVQDWYESRNEQPTILFLDLTDVAGNDTAKAGLANAGIKKSAALTQELDKPYNSLRFECDVFISKIEATGSTNRTAHLYLGNDQDGKYPLGAAKERFVWLAFYDPQPGGAGSDLQLRARTSPSQPENDTSTWVLLASKLDHAIWHELRVRIDGAKGLYDVQLDGELVAEDVPKYAEYTDSSVSYVGFAAETYARGNFFVDRALASIDDLSLTGLVTLPGGAPAQQATITARLLYCGTTYTTQTDNTGHYLLEGLPPDTYRVSARKTIGNVTYGRDICSVPYEDGTVDLDISIVPNWPLCQDQ